MKTHIEIYMEENGIEPADEKEIQDMGEPDEVIIIDESLGEDNEIK
ncbi:MULTISPECIES: hypothetical protein [Erysipelotrichaceae]|uniref:Uncharacterized protein n=1 Tax=Amedibacterium intestinale TaxID=2583452 RepID=A0A6N4TIP6_9FIRM|nr:hypothetical protein [Amedibacterium intestinale]BBK22609.1 hypothetical protein Aargi30884_15120 [Amedibacterium intestinale]